MRIIRSLLFFVAVLIVLPAWGYGISTGKLFVALPGLLIFGTLIYFSLKKLVCPGCGKTVRTISAKLANCPFCGAEYEL